MKKGEEDAAAAAAAEFYGYGNGFVAIKLEPVKFIGLIESKSGS